MMDRGDIYWVNLEPMRGTEINKLRPCVILSASPINQVRRTVIIIPLSTSAKPRPPIAIAVKCLEREVVAVCDQLRTIDKSRLVKPADSLTHTDLVAIEDGIRQVWLYRKR